MATRQFVISGGPGAGNTSLCDALGALGITIIAESGRAVIREQVRTGGHALPWVNPTAYADAIMTRDLWNIGRASRLSGPCLFDRSVIDNAAYLEMLGLPVPAQLYELCRHHRFDDPILIAPPWRSIYQQDDERKQDWDEAKRACEAMIATYRAFGYRLVELPKVSLVERIRFVMAILHL